jgi:hypothetical protein
MYYQLMQQIFPFMVDFFFAITPTSNTLYTILRVLSIFFNIIVSFVVTKVYVDTRNGSSITVLALCIRAALSLPKQSLLSSV